MGTPLDWSEGACCVGVWALALVAKKRGLKVQKCRHYKKILQFSHVQQSEAQ